MKILKKGKKLHQIFEETCTSCETVYEYGKSDIQYDREGSYVICPVCGHFHGITFVQQFDRSREC